MSNLSSTKTGIEVIEVTNANSPNSVVVDTGLSASREFEGVYIANTCTAASSDGTFGFVRRLASNYLTAVIIGASDPAPITSRNIECFVEVRPRLAGWHEALAALKTPRFATPRGRTSTTARVIPPKLKTFEITDNDLLCWRRR